MAVEDLREAKARNAELEEQVQRRGPGGAIYEGGGAVALACLAGAGVRSSTAAAPSVNGVLLPAVIVASPPVEARAESRGPDDHVARVDVLHPRAEEDPAVDAGVGVGHHDAIA